MLTLITDILTTAHTALAYVCHTVWLLGFVLVQLLTIAASAGVLFYEAVAHLAADCYHIAEHVATVGLAGCHTAIDAALHAGDVAAELLTTGRLAREQLPAGITAALSAGADATRSFIRLIGDSVWLLLTFVPNVLLFAVRAACVLARSAAQSVREFCAEVPAQAAVGWALLLAAIVFRSYTVPLAGRTGRLLWRRLVLPVCVAAANGLLNMWRTLTGLLTDGLRTQWRRLPAWPTAGRLMRHVHRAPEIKPSGDAAAAVNRDTVCVICTDRPKRVLLLPCRHLCLCVGCAERLLFEYRQQGCPLCRFPVERSMHVFT